ncbi:TraG family conjugative transposon ATPase [Butyricimonas synergistica]|uniref:TraG family conjugative transposon ATPase n=1 Tax=Butyricimonas synergistica TaxID=544644 RepID=UPI00036B886B|nr:TraG family conjugative transposon ATPase [Butyricimonas synergistica]
MRNTLKATTLENKLPLLSVENDCIISKDADITVCFRVELPEIFTITAAEYEQIHGAWVKAISVLPEYSVVHKQDWFIEEKYEADFEKEMTFLERSSELHFNERPYLEHSCYLYLTKTTKQRARQQSNFSTLCRGNIIPGEVNKESFTCFRESVEQFKKIMDDSGCIRLTRLTGDEIIGTPESTGLIEKYLSLSDTGYLHDIELHADHVRVGDKTTCLHTLSDVEDLPGFVNTDTENKRYSTTLSFGGNLGLLLDCNHIYNQYVFLDSTPEILQKFEKSARTMLSLSRYSRANQINQQWMELFLNAAHSKGLMAVRCHANVIAWSENVSELKRVKNEVGSQITAMGCKARYNISDAATLFWAAMPGNAGDFPAEESFFTFVEQAVCFFSSETNYKTSLSPFGIKMCDRTGKPLHVDISDLPMKKGIITNRNKFILGPSGSGKSFFTNHMVRQYYEQGAHVLLVDTGNSYLGLSQLIHNRTFGEDGIYFTYTNENPIAFNPFYVEDGFFDIEKKESIKTLILTLWKRDDEAPTRAEEVALSNVVSSYIELITKDRSVTPCFNTFYEYVKTDYREHLQEKNVREKDFDIDNFLNVLEPYYKDGEYDYLLNSDKELDLLHKRFIVFELDNIKDHKILFPITTIIIMEAFINKMRKLKGIRKLILIEEAWKAIASANMADYIKYLYKTVRKYFGEAVVVTQEIEDIISSSIVKESIINNSDCKILLDQRKYLNKFDSIQNLLGLTDKERSQILSINMANHPGRKYKEVFFSLGSTQSAVYATEVSIAEYLTYTTEESEKLEVLRRAEKLGNIELAIKQLACEKRGNN